MELIENEIAANGIKLHIYRTNTHKPPLVFAHGRSDNSEQAITRHKEWEEFNTAVKEKSVQDLVEMNRRDSPTWPEAEREPWAQSKLQYHLKPFGEDRIDVALGQKIVSQITCPVLMITADLDKGAIFPPQAADELVAGLPNAKHINIPGAGHNIRREQPEAFLTAVRDFLKG